MHLVENSIFAHHLYFTPSLTMTLSKWNFDTMFPRRKLQ